VGSLSDSWKRGRPARRLRQQSDRFA